VTERVEFVKELQAPKGPRCLVRRGDEYFVVSSVVALMSGPETLVFPADAEGSITDWGEVAGGRGVSREEAIAELEANGPQAHEHDFGDAIEAIAEIAEQAKRGAP
jgi:hypothetical protein